MRRIDQYEAAKPKINEIQLKDFQSYHIGKLLYSSAWSMFGFSAGQKLMRVLALLVCKALWLSDCEDTAEGKNLAFDICLSDEKIRKDNETIFQNLYEYMKPAKHLLLKKQYCVHIPGIFRRLKSLLLYCGSIHGFSLSERLYLAAQLVLAKDLIDLLEKEKAFQNIEYMLIFQECEMLSSTVIQCAHQHAVQVISPQHGMPMNRHENIDQLFFDCFQCDYKLVWNDFEKGQYLSAGIDPGRLFVVGNTKNLGEQQPASGTVVLREEHWRQFGILLDCPKSDGACVKNCQLLRMAKVLADVEKMRCVVKLHPVDHAGRYADILDSAWAEVLPPSVGMEEYQESVAFSLAHITGAIFDLIYGGYYVFQYISSEKYPVDLDDIYRFISTEELLQHIHQWRNNFEKYQKEYKKTVEKYRVSNARERHDAFFQRLFASELKIESVRENGKDMR